MGDGSRGDSGGRLGCGKSVIRIAPALSIKTGEIDEGLQIFEEALTLAEQESGS